MRAKQLKGFPVIDLGQGVMLGRVQDLAVDPAAKKVTALVIGEKGLLKGRGRLISFAQVHSIGKDAITVGGGTEENGTEEAATKQLRPYSFLGKSVISSSGNYIARVYDYAFSTATGALEALLLHDFKEGEKKNREFSLQMEGVYSLGQDYVIAGADYDAYLHEASAEEKEGAEAEEEKERTTERETTAGGEEDGEERPVKLQSRIAELWERVEKEVSREGRELALETREQVKKYVLGKKAGYTVKNSRGNFLVRGGEVITAEILKEAEAEERLAPLFFSVLSQDVEESLNLIGERIGRIFKG